MRRESRRYRRVCVPVDADVSCQGLDTDLQGSVLVMGLGGLFIRTPVVFPKGTVFHVCIRDRDCEVEALCAVRNLAPEGLGVEFVQLRGRHEENLKAILKRLVG
jgi:hypothetical protein